MINDTRPLLGKNGSVRLSPSAFAKGRRLCDYCSVAAQCGDIVTDTCPTFVPPLFFRPPHLGFEAAFSTVRLGMAWTKRVKPLDLVGLIEVGQDKPFAFARVASIKSGPLHKMIKDHAHTNHLMLGKTKVKARAELADVIIAMYGKNWSAPERPATTIFCERVAEEEEARIRAAWPNF